MHISIVRTIDKWSGLYIGGTLQSEGYCLDEFDVALLISKYVNKLSKMGYTGYKVKCKLYKTDENYGIEDLPNKFEEIAEDSLFLLREG